ncbi:hypothetical protein HFO71_24050 [Rhizobium laguerreae]|uniref:hypothetical protein n=1 Tax=Rhizobium laguerreae TaxID=1076926 RepID=UPI001C901E97|nr:hypothetical protein [Rhizobium laguerreae]MBY3073391.1 hypothetical protein [Rhizobium laguerreae]
MKAIGVVLLLAAVFASHAQASETVTVKNNPGGIREDFDAQARKWAKDGVKIRLVGSCASACNMYLMTKYGLDVCAVAGTRLKFHMPYFEISQDGGRRWSREMNPQTIQESKQLWAKNWLGHFSPKLNAVLAKATRNGVIPNPSTEVQGYEGQFTGSRFYSVKATDFIPTCD